MARPVEKSLKYFPFDVDYFNDEKIEAISGEFGIRGEIVSIKLLCAIYRNGYYIEWSDLYKMKLLRNLPTIKAEELDAIVSRLAQWGFFNLELFTSHSILTSEGIQTRYFEATRRRKLPSELPYLLVDAILPDPTESTEPIPAPPEPSTSPASAASPTPVISPEQIKSLCQRFSLSPEQIQQRLEEFNLDCSCRGTVHTDTIDALRHFNDWLRIVLEEEKKQSTPKPNENRQNTSSNKRRGVETGAAVSTQDYDLAF